MDQETKNNLNKADYIKIVWAKKLGRFVYQTYDTPDTMTQDERLIGGGEIPVLIEYLQLLNR